MTLSTHTNAMQQRQPRIAQRRVLRSSKPVHPRTCAPSELVQEIKTGSSKWLKTKGARYPGFHWQGGYGIFSISPAHRLALETCVANQAEHHRKVTFKDEYRRLLTKYGIAFDERYVWD